MTTALLIIDMQMEMTHRTEGGRDRVNPQTEARVADLLSLLGSDFAQVMPTDRVAAAL